MTNLPLGSYPPPQPTYAQHLLPGWESRIQEKDGPFLEAFDFSFDRYATPAVVGVHAATERLVTGQLIRLDGSSGHITLLED